MDPSDSEYSGFRASTFNGLERRQPGGSWWRQWWRRQSTVRQDRFAVLAPIASVLLFLAAIVAALSYLRIEEMDREREALKPNSKSVCAYWNAKTNWYGCHAKRPMAS
jgi:hypothetical protein